MSSENQPVSVNVQEFVNKTYADFAKELEKFRKISSNKSKVSDEEILSQATVFLIDIAKKMSLKYVEKVDNDAKLVYDIAVTLVHDERVSKSIGIVGVVWNQLPEVQEFLNFSSFNTTLLSREAFQKLDATLNETTCC